MSEPLTPLIKDFVEKADAEMAKLKAKLDADSQKARERFEAEMERLRPTQSQYDELLDTKNRLLGIGTTRKVAGRKASTARAPRGNRQAQFLEAVTTNPGQGASEYARVMGMDTNYVYRLRKLAADKGEIEVRDGKIYPATPDPLAPSAERIKELEAAAA